MKRNAVGRLTLAGVTAVALLLAGCGSSVVGTATVGSTGAPRTSASSAEAPNTSPSTLPQSSEITAPSSKTSTSTSATSRPTSSETTSAVPTSAAPTSKTTVATGSDQTLDETSVTWVTSFCNGYAEIAGQASPETKGMSKSETIATVVRTYRDISQGADKTAADLTSLNPPTFDGGDAVATAMSKWFSGLAEVYSNGADTIEAGSYSTPSDLTDAIDAIEEKVRPLNAELGVALADIPDWVRAALVELPACGALAAAANAGG